MRAPGQLVLVSGEPEWLARVVEDMDDTVLVQPVDPDTMQDVGAEIEVGDEEITNVAGSIVDGELEEE